MRRDECIYAWIPTSLPFADRKRPNWLSRSTAEVSHVFPLVIRAKAGMTVRYDQKLRPACIAVLFCRNRPTEYERYFWIDFNPLEARPTHPHATKPPLPSPPF